jgi:hypothetical protein
MEDILAALTFIAHIEYYSPLRDLALLPLISLLLESTSFRNSPELLIIGESISSPGIEIFSIRLGPAALYADLDVNHKETSIVVNDRISGLE